MEYELILSRKIENLKIAGEVIAQFVQFQNDAGRLFDKYRNLVMVANLMDEDFEPLGDFPPQFAEYFKNLNSALHDCRGYSLYKRMAEEQMRRLERFISEIQGSEAASSFMSENYDWRFKISSPRAYLTKEAKEKAPPAAPDA